MSSVKEVQGTRVGPGRDFVKLMFLRIFQKVVSFVLTLDIGVSSFGDGEWMI